MKYRPNINYHGSLIDKIRSTPADCTHLDLGGILYEGASSFSMQDVIACLPYIPARVSILELNSNSLCLKDDGEIRALIAAIPPSITHINLSNNFYLVPSQSLYSLQHIKFITILSTLSSRNNLMVLDLRHNYLNRFYYLDEKSLSTMVSVKSFSINTLYVTSDEIIRISKKQLDLFAKILPASQVVNVMDKDDRHLVISNKINYLARQIIAPYAKKLLDGSDQLKKLPWFSDDLKYNILSFLLEKKEADICSRYKFTPNLGFFYNPLTNVTERNSDLAIRVNDIYQLKRYINPITLLLFSLPLLSQGYGLSACLLILMSFTWIALLHKTLPNILPFEWVVGDDTSHAGYLYTHRH